MTVTEGTGHSSAGRAGLVRADTGQSLLAGPGAVLIAGGEATGGAVPRLINTHGLRIC